jgi:hypothetical protein
MQKELISDLNHFFFWTGRRGCWWHSSAHPLGWQVNLGENRAAGCLGGEIQHVGQRVDIRLRYQVEQAKVAAGKPASIRLQTTASPLETSRIQHGLCTVISTCLPNVSYMCVNSCWKYTVTEVTVLHLSFYHGLVSMHPLIFHLYRTRNDNDNISLEEHFEDWKLSPGSQLYLKLLIYVIYLNSISWPSPFFKT